MLVLHLSMIQTMKTLKHGCYLHKPLLCQVPHTTRYSCIAVVSRYVLTPVISHLSGQPDAFVTLVDDTGDIYLTLSFFAKYSCSNLPWHHYNLGIYNYPHRR